ncbi:MAG TPA: hypothetical protein VK102_09310 [Sphingobacterium sp.]|nr:hypothetical protein [Sphingobacterium sp.]
MSLRFCTQFYIILLCFTLLKLSTLNAQEKSNLSNTEIKEFISDITYESLGQNEGDLRIEQIHDGLFHVSISFSLTEPVQQDDWQVRISPAFIPSFNWAPHLTPESSNIIDQHVFRSPALIISDKNQLLSLIPDLDNINENQSSINWYMDMDAKNNVLTLGMSKSKISEHVLFEREKGTVYPKGKVKVSFYLIHSKDKQAIHNPFRPILSFLWKNWGEKLFIKGQPIPNSLEPYVEHTYHWAFNSWKKQVWQEFTIHNKKVGAPTFIVNVTQSPNYKDEVNEREFRSIWNQAWFSSLRSASGLYRYARRTKNQDLMDKAVLTKELALSFPKKEGFFYGLIGTDMHDVEINGKKYSRSTGWDSYFWGNSNRNPYTADPRKSPFHILDMSWTANLMLQWFEELEKDIRLLQYAEEYAKSLINVQFDNGFFPGWLELNTLKPMQYLNNSPESALSATFLLNLYRLTEKETYKTSALKAIDAVVREIVKEGKWEDFETYWSCSRIGSQNWVGKKIKRNNMYKHNNFSMYWTAEALLKSYHITGKKQYLQLGQKTLDELLMTQASWQPHYIPIKALGGFGVLNADGEWNDARQSLFSELIIKYGQELDNKEYIQRGLAALRASFVMMYSPENPETKKQWEKAWPFFDPEDYGFMMENYGHGGETDAEGLGIGEFTIYDWGNGAASEAYNRILDHYGEDFIYQKPN